MKTIDLSSRLFSGRKMRYENEWEKTEPGNQNLSKSKIAEKTRRIFYWKHIWIYPFCVFMVYLLSGGFISQTVLRILFSPVFAFPFFLSLVQMLYRRRNTYIRSQCKVLFQSLCTSVSGGYSLESAFLAARSSVEGVFGKKCLLGKNLERMESERAAQLPFAENLTRLCLRLDYLEIFPIMQALTITRVVGSGVISILRSSCQMITELISINNEVDANNAGKNAEAMLLCLMPYGITFTLSAFTGEYMETARNTPLGTAMMIAAFGVSVCSCALLLRLVGDTKKNAQAKSGTDRRTLPLPQKATAAILRFLRKILPESFISREYEQALELSDTPNDYLHVKIRKLITVLSIEIPGSLVVCRQLNVSLLYVLPSCGIFILFFHFNEKQKVLQRREAIMEDIPLFLAILATLLQSGVLLSKAIAVCAGAFPPDGILGSEILWMKKRISSGISAAQVIEDFSSRTPIPEAQAALLLAAQFERKGGIEVVQLLDLQSNACWNLCRNASRKKKERSAVQMLLPMMLDLIAVLLVVMTPAVLSLNGLSG